MTVIDEKITSNFYLVAAFVSLGARIVNTDRSDSAHIEFRVAGPNLAEIKQKWDEDTLMVSARKYADAVRHVKSFLFQKD